MATVLLGVPMYKHDVHGAAMFSMMRATNNKHTIHRMESDSSAQCYAMNCALIQAIEMHEAGECDYFAMHHTDIDAEGGWLDTLIEIYQAKHADLLSAVVPLKCETGLTSTALDESVNGSDQRWNPRRLSMREVYDKEPTFTAPNMLLNTGLMIFDLSKPWVDKVYFSFVDRIVKDQSGKRSAVFEPDDWGFSRLARSHGATRQFATRAIRLNHWGEARFGNHKGWGTMASDGVLA